jgi:uncharacterized protein (DUF1697 family)
VHRYVAFLRAINVGGHTVRMEQLRRHFEALGFVGVSTFIASGNVLFESDAADAAGLERRIEAALRAALGYEVATFLRTDRELARIAAYRPFSGLEDDPAHTAYVAFLHRAPDQAAVDRLAELSSDQDRLHVHERELYWLRRGGLADAAIGPVDFARALGNVPTTVRNVNTVRRLAAKYPAATG